MDDEKLDGLSMDIELAERDKLRAVFPQCFTEGKLDIDKLLNLCGEYITDDFEKYGFKWKGKSECPQLAGGLCIFRCFGDTMTKHKRKVMPCLT